MASREEYFNLATRLFFIRKEGTGTEYKKGFPLLGNYLYHTLGIHSLCRYRPVDDGKWGRDQTDLESDLVWLQPMSKQNDPYEFSFNLDSFNLPVEEYLASFLTFDLSAKDFIDLLWRQYQDYRNKCAIACLCERPDNILLWSHYADSHRGYCVEYSSIDLLKKFQYFLLPVIYHDKLPTFPDTLSGDMKEELLPYYMVLKTITSKASVWSHEQEWRVVRTLKSEEEKISFPTPKAIYLGCEASSELESDLKSICKSKGIPLFKMIKSRTDYKLNPEPLQK